MDGVLGKIRRKFVNYLVYIPPQCFDCGGEMVHVNLMALQELCEHWFCEKCDSWNFPAGYDIEDVCPECLNEHERSFCHSDFWGPEDTIRSGMYDNSVITSGEGPYLSLIPKIDLFEKDECDCGHGFDLGYEDVIIERFYHDRDYYEDCSYDVVVKCPDCGKVWRDAQ